ncbi:MAG: methylcrotonoyl-CoA carboxylase [Cytophagaceae bacterium SCN 52-12]|nr:MAG: methylcrotonoyl-CoA carboxylase [Cytophagaceae bacterium SCN 52-12]
MSDENSIEELCHLLKVKREEVRFGGGLDKLAAQHKKGKLTARERVACLLDDQENFLEIGEFAGDGMYPEEGGCASGGVVAGLGYVAGRLCMIVANDASVKGGAWFPVTAKKNLRAQEIAMENRIPVIYLVDSAGIYLPLQADTFADKEHFGRIFRNNARMTSMGIFQISAVMGSCVAGGAYLPAMSDEALMVEGTGSLFLAGPYLVRSSIGEEADQELLGGARMHSEISGVIDNRYPDDKSCLEAVRKRISTLARPPGAGFDRIEPRSPRLPPESLFELLPADRLKPYDTFLLLDCIIDEGGLDEYKPDYGKSLICAYARIDGWSVGIVANQRKMVKSGKGEMQMGGVIYSDAADKAARFIMNCNQKKIPLVFFQDVTGFMVGSRSEQGGIIRDGAKMVNAVANSIVPKFTVIVGNSYGAGNYAMCGKAYDPRLIYAWPTARISVMSGATAAKTLVQIQAATRKAKGEELSAEEEDALLQTISERYDAQLSPYYAAARLWVDGIIDPLETRKVISMGIDTANHAPLENTFNVGVIQV